MYHNCLCLEIILLHQYLQNTMLLYLTQTDQCSAYSISASTLEDLMVYFLGYEKLVCSKDIFGGHQYSYSSAVS